jgi:tRNA(Ile)-lysidine synthase
MNAAGDDGVPMESLLRAAIEVALSRFDEPVVLAISGGRDSMALMHAMARWAPERLAAVATFDHGTGGYATEAAAMVAADARRLGLTVVRERARVPAHSEAAWRDARWQFLSRVAVAYKARIATAHTRDDQVETIVMRALRGAGARGLAALAAPSRIVRPWLPVGRAEVAAWAQRVGVSFLEDPMNASHRFQRGRVRHDLLPALLAVQPTFADDMLALGDRAAAWRRDVEGLLDAGGAMSTRRGTLRLRVSLFADTTDEGRAILWAAAFGRVGVALDARGTQTLVRFSNSGRRGAHVRVAGGAIAVRLRDGHGAGAGDGDVFEVRVPARARPERASAYEHGREHGREHGTEGWQGEASQLPTRVGRWRIRRLTPTAARDAADDPFVIGVSVGSTVTVRPWAPGDRISTAGAPAGRRISRYFSDRHIPALDRSGWPVVLVDGVLWYVPGICRSLAAPYRPGWPDSIWYRCEREFD